MKKALTSIISVVLLIIGFTVCVSFHGGVQTQAAGTKTGVGLAEHALKAYNTGWKYSYGAYGQISGGTRISDCAGLIKAYLWWTNDSSNPRAGSVAVGGGASSMLNSASVKGTINYSNPSSLPRIHGLILYQPGHVGVYIGNNTAVDNRDYGYNIKKEPVFGRARIKWTMWFKLPQINYPTTGWATFNGQTYYYENGQYVVSTTRTIGGKTYSFGANGVVNGSAPATVTNTTTASVTKSYAASASKVSASKATASKAAADKKAAEAKAAASKAAASKAAAAKLAADQAKAASQAALASSQAEAGRQNAALASTGAAVSSQSPVVSLTDEVIPQAAAPALAQTEQKPANTDSSCAIIIAILAVILSGSIVFERKLNKLIQTKRYVPEHDMVFQRVSHYIKSRKLFIKK